ncbi:hypothetical protein FZC66_09025 [Priestia megaterium]|nr:hypothetical protein FZC66_09025 [Priestia megaterium]
MKVATYQFDIRFGDKEFNLKKIDHSLENVNADLIVLPEFFTTGILFSGKEQILKQAELIPGDYTCNKLIEIASKHRCHLIGSIIEIDNGSLYNTAVVIGPDGYIGKQRKIHLPNYEKQFFAHGDELNVFNIKDTKVGVITCFDCWFPEASRILASKGAQIICHSANIISASTYDIVKVRAMENVVFFISSNRIGSESNQEQAWSFRGESRIIDPKGNILAMSKEEEELLVTEIDSTIAIEKKTEDCNDLLNQAQMYQIVK